LDAVELGRQTAARIHAELLEEGCDPWDPMAIVVAAAARCGINEITPLRPGSPLLAKSRASYDPLSNSIQHEDCGDAFMNAFLIGHEVGHATLGDDRISCEGLDFDPARSSEAAPDGEERVADYSRKSRRETQMDLFARELLMPRPFVRQLQLGGMSAEAIAARLGAPYDAVAQQLLDALLLPAVELVDDGADDFPLNTKQQAAATHRGGAFLLEAGPGTGKTKTLVGRVCDLLEKGEDPRGIVVLTFSNKAAGELSSRIAARRPEDAAAMWIGTFHAFGLNLVRRFHGALGFDREPKLLDRAEAIDLMLDRVAELELNHYRELYDPTDKLRDMLSAISRAQDEVVLAPRYAELVDAMAASDDPETRERAAKAGEVARVYASYSQIKKNGHRADFGDLVALPVDLLERKPDLVAALRSEYRHILVDEYQDVNRACVRLLQQITDQGKNLWCVGDIRQSIYRFRGASSFNMGRFDTEDFADATRDHLDVNYRSTEEIVSAYSAFAARIPLEGAMATTLHAHRGASGHAPEFRHVIGDNEREIDDVADMINAMCDAGHAYRDQALLCSGNDRLAKIGRGLEARGIPILYLGSLFERPEVKDLLAWLSLLVDRRAMAVARGTGAAGLKLGLSDIAIISHSLRDNLSEPLAWMRTPPADLSAPGKAVVTGYAALFSGFDVDADPWFTLARLLLDRSSIAAEITAATDVAGRARGIAVWQFMNFVRAQPRGRPGAIVTLLERIRRLVRLSDDRDLRQIPQAASGINAVRLMTMHGSKGLEFPVVHIPGMTKNTLPRSPANPVCPPPDGLIAGTNARGREVTDREHVEEQQCLFYVALSRAKDRLILYSPNQTRTGTRRDSSPFTARLGPGLACSAPVPKTCSAPVADPAVDIVYTGQPVFEQSQIGLYERCPRRFFYTHILGLGGRRTTTPYEDMHDIVRVVIAELLAAPVRPIDPVGLKGLIDIQWALSPLSEFPAGAAYRPIVDELVQRFVESFGNDEVLIAPALAFPIEGAEVRAQLDYASRDQTGSTVYRQIRTGHKRTTEMNGAAVLVPLFAVRHAAPGCAAEILFLSDDEREQLEWKEKTIETRRGHLSASVASILAGDFQTDPSPRTCPKCPAFFTCGDLADGAVEKKFA
jgi:superfamily I DNA/RNA helicase/Zn-dependent peptidase ImmA (M78 family)